MNEACIPVIDVADYLTERPGTLEATARQLHDALTTVGFFVVTGQTSGSIRRSYSMKTGAK